MARSAYLEVPDQSSPFDYYADAWRDACPGKLPPGISIGGRLGLEIHGAESDLLKMAGELAVRGVTCWKNNFRT